MAIESEITYTVKKLPDNLKQFPNKQIRQGFYSDLPSPLRIRDCEGTYYLTKKFKISGDASRQEEIEMPIKQEEFDLLWPLCTKSLSKTRYYYPLDNLTAEIDLYHGPLEGFINVEVEFPNEETRGEFSIPDWFDKDITQYTWATNSELSELTFEKIQEKLQALK